jgi:hypothetical protein
MELNSGMRFGIPVWLPLGLALASIVLLIVMFNKWADEEAIERDLLELGQVSVPRRMESRSPDENQDRVFFYFERAELSLVPGNLPSIGERISIATWADGMGPETSPAWEWSFRALANSQVEDLRWRSEGHLIIGEGNHRVGATIRPAWVLMHRSATEPVWIAYMTLSAGVSLDQAKAVIERIAASFKRHSTQQEFFAVVGRRPLERRAALMGLLAEHGIDLELDAPPVTRDSTAFAYFVADPWPEGAWLQIVHFIGTLPAGPARFRQNWHNHPNFTANWPTVIYFRSREGDWLYESTLGDHWLTPALVASLAGRHTDATKVYFYATHTVAVDEAEPDNFGVEGFMRILSEMESKFAVGELIEGMN